MRSLLIFIPILVFLSGASLSDFKINDNIKNLNKFENKNSQLIVDYDRIKKAYKYFRFFPVYFYISKDGCNTPGENIKKDEVIDADICIGFNVIDDFHYLRLELITPDEAVYQNLNIFIDKEGSPPRKIRYKGDYTPYNISKPVILNGVNFVKHSIPVAGSSIQSQNLIGKWKINLFIDDSSYSYGTAYFIVE